MITTSLLVSAPVVPAAIVVIGVLSALRTQVRRRATTHTQFAERRVPIAFALPRAGNDSCQADLDTTSDSNACALQLLDQWCECPRSVWVRVGTRALRTTPADAGALSTSQVILEGIIAHHVSPIDAWTVRDAVHTAWHLAPDDQATPRPKVEFAARRAVTNAALAMMAREWLAEEDFARLLGCIEA